MSDRAIVIALSWMSSLSLFLSWNGRRCICSTILEVALFSEDVCIGLNIFGSVRFWTKINNQTEFVFFLVFEPNRTENRFKPINFGLVRFGFFPFQTGSNRNDSGEFFLGFLLTTFFTVTQKSNNVNTSA